MLSWCIGYRWSRISKFVISTSGYIMDKQGVGKLIPERSSIFDLKLQDMPNLSGKGLPEPTFCRLNVKALPFSKSKHCTDLPLSKHCIDFRSH